MLEWNFMSDFHELTFKLANSFSRVFTPRKFFNRDSSIKPSLYIPISQPSIILSLPHHINIEIGAVSLPDKLNDLINLIMHIAQKPPNNCKIIAVFTCNYELFAFLATKTTITTSGTATRAANTFGILIINHFTVYYTI